MTQKNPYAPRQAGRRRLLALAAGMGAATLCPGARAQVMPQKLARIVIPVAAGGPTDLLGRIIGERLSVKWNRPVIFENRAGASGTIGSGVVARSEPDGNTLLLQAISHVINPSLLKQLPYHPIDDFTPIMGVAYQPVILCVHPSVPAKTVEEFVRLAVREPDQMTCGVAQIGSIGHLAGVLLEQRANMKLLTVPFAGASQAVTALLGGHVKSCFLNTTVAMPLFAAGTARGLGTTSLARWPALPNLPTIAEQGYADFEAIAWYAFVGPARMPAALVQQLYADIRSVLQADDVRQRLFASGFDLLDQPPEKIRAVMIADMKKWADVIARAGIKLS